MSGYADCVNVVVNAGYPRPRENPGPPLYTAYEPDRCLRLVAEMKLPGRAWLEFEVHPQGDGAMIRQAAVFDPVGVLGLLYW